MILVYGFIADYKCPECNTPVCKDFSQVTMNFKSMTTTLENCKCTKCKIQCDLIHAKISVDPKGIEQ